MFFFFFMLIIDWLFRKIRDVLPLMSVDSLAEVERACWMTCTARALVFADVVVFYRVLHLYCEFNNSR